MASHAAVVGHPYIRATAILVALTTVLVGSWSILAKDSEWRLASYLTLHSFMETCSIVVSGLVFVVSRARDGERRNRNMVMLGAAFLGVALLDFIHTHSYLGMPDLVTPSSPGKAINFWLAARLLAAGALLAAAFLSWERTVAATELRRWTAVVVAAVAMLTWVFLYRPHWMPQTFVPGRGLTPLKIYIEFVVILLSLGAAIGYYRLIARSNETGSGPAGIDPVALLAASIVTAMAEIYFTIYTDVNGVYNAVGHVYKVIGAWFLYRGLVANNLIEVETRAKLALDAAEFGSWSWNATTDSVEWDEKAASCWGVAKDVRPSMAVIDAHVHPDDRAAKQKALQRALDPSGDGIYAADYRIVLRDGSIRHISSHGKTQFYDSRAIRVIGVVRDVTARREAMQSVRQSEVRLSTILSIAADAIITIDQQHCITLFNQGAEQIFGYASSEVIGKPLDTLLPERHRSGHTGLIRQFAASGTTARRMGERREVYGRRKDGSEFPAEASISKLELSGIVSFTAVVRDITERKMIEQQLEQRVAERTAELFALLDALPDGILHADNDGRVRIVNASMTRLFGFGRSELIGMRAGELYATPADGDSVSNAWSSWEQGRALAPVAVSCRHKDGSTFPAMLRGNVVRDSAGRTLSRVSIIRDISDELKRQKALTQAQRMEAFGQLTGGIAHDFNNLLTVISGNQELLEMRLQDAKDLALLKRAQEAAEMGARLTGRLLTFARRRPLAPTALNLNDQITAMVDLLRRSIGEQIELTTNLMPRLPPVLADSSEIENAVLNLAINARDAMPNGGAIRIEASEHLVERGDSLADGRLAPGPYVRLSVSDTGTGMPPEVVARAFEPFFTTKQPGKGTGLGLSTIYGSIQQLGGTVTIYSEVGRGTTVNIFLPRADGFDQGIHNKLDDTAIPLAAGETVLLVEDNPGVRDVARRHIEELGYAVREVDTGVAAIDLLKSGAGPFDLVFSDVVMPGGMSGYDVARWVAGNAPDLKVLLASGYPGDIAANGEKDIPDVQLLRKPYSRVELARALRLVLDN